MFLIPESSWEVKDTKEHGRGIFATKEISAGTVIGDYTGRVIRPQEEDEVEKGAHFYLMYYHDYASIYPDLKKPGIHLINHSCTPNVWMYTYHGHTLYFALRKIFRGEQITVSYQLSPLDKNCAPCTHTCTCGAALCFQTMHLSQKRYKEWDAFQTVQEDRTPRERVRFGELLPPLASYPKSIPDNSIYILFGAKQELSVKLMDKKIPSKTEMRKIIRDTGRTIHFYNLNLKVHGVFEDLLISESRK